MNINENASTENVTEIRFTTGGRNLHTDFLQSIIFEYHEVKR